MHIPIHELPSSCYNPATTCIQQYRDASGLWLTGAARSAEVFRACLQCTLDADESLEAATCAPLVAVLGRWCHVGGGAFSLRSLGAPTIDASSGLSDGGGPYAESCGELAANLAGMAALILELLIDDVDAFLASPASESELQVAINALLACSDHPLSVAAEVAAEGWLCLLAALPPAAAGEAQLRRAQLFSDVVRRTLLRSSHAQLRSGTGEDKEDLEQWRARSAAPLLAACSEALGAANWWPALLATIRSTADVEALEVALFCAACTSPRCIGDNWAHEGRAQIRLQIEQSMQGLDALAPPAGVKEAGAVANVTAWNAIRGTADMCLQHLAALFKLRFEET